MAKVLQEEFPHNIQSHEVTFELGVGWSKAIFKLSLDLTKVYQQFTINQRPLNNQDLNNVKDMIKNLTNAQKSYKEHAERHSQNLEELKTKKCGTVMFKLMNGRTVERIIHNNYATFIRTIISKFMGIDIEE